MFGSVSDWDFLLSSAYAAIKPGGWIENAEHGVQPISDDDTVGPDHIFTDYGRNMTEMGRKRGKEFEVYRHAKERMERAGFVDVVETRMKWPMGPWSSDKKMKELGRWNKLRCERGIEGFVMRMFTNDAGVSALFRGDPAALTSCIVDLYRSAGISGPGERCTAGQDTTCLPRRVSLFDHSL